MDISKNIIENLNEEELFEMSNLLKRQTGLPVNIWVDDIGIERKIEHNMPRIKVQNNTSNRRQADTFSLSISKNPKILKGECKLNASNFNKVRDYVIKNYDILIKYWNQEIDIVELEKLLFD